MTSYTVAVTSLEQLHDSGAQLVEAAGSSKPQIHKGSGARESAHVSDENYGECVRCDTRTSDQGHSPSEVQSRRWD